MITNYFPLQFFLKLFLNCVVINGSFQIKKKLYVFVYFQLTIVIFNYNLCGIACLKSIIISLTDRKIIQNKFVTYKGMFFFLHKLVKDIRLKCWSTDASFVYKFFTSDSGIKT